MIILIKNLKNKNKNNIVEKYIYIIIIGKWKEERNARKKEKNVINNLMKIRGKNNSKNENESEIYKKKESKK